MPPLATQLRNRLEASVKQARRTGEAAAKVALERLTVGNAEPGTHLTVEERPLRNRLRAHGRQLGDQRDPTTGEQSINRLIHECAYEHWHRMLFARFLSENRLLIHEGVGMPVTLAECDELAPDEGAPDGWTLAARYAARMLPQIFRSDDPVLQFGFAPEHKRALEKLVTELPVEVFTAEDSLGWVYQFWQAERKDQVNASGDKITGETLPAVTQLFTEHYMVLFLLHNTIGAWWAARLKSEGRVPKAEWDKCQTEDDCRKLAALPGYEFAYLRFIKDSNGEWVPAAGGFSGWPKALKDFKLLDPCCGSGHFLVAAFVLLALLRIQDEKLSDQNACDAVLRENLHGLELDPRCTQIAAFALALTAWKFTKGFRSLPPLNIACVGLGVNAKKEDWLKLAERAAQPNPLAPERDLLGTREETLLSQKLRSGMERLYQLFQKAPVLGSLINPHALGGDLLVAEFHDLQPLLAKALEYESGDEGHELAVTAQGLAKGAEILASTFTLVVTNVPYLSNRKQCDELKNFCTDNYEDAKNDLGVTFMLRLLELCSVSGSVALVMSQYWLFKSSYSKARRSLLKKLEWPLLAKLGVGAFETISGEVVNVLVGVWKNTTPAIDSAICGINAMDCRTPTDKAEALKTGPIIVLSQTDQIQNPASRIVVGETSEIPTLELMTIAPQGTKTGDDDRWRVCMWEIDVSTEGWLPYQTTVRSHVDYGGRHLYLDWRTGGEGMVRPRIENRAVGKWGVAISQSGDLPATIYSGERFDSNVAPLIISDGTILPALWAYCTSEDYLENVRLIDQSLKVTNVPLIQVPFDLSHWQNVAAEKYPNGLPKPFSSDPTQWLFNGHPKDSDRPLLVGVARLVAYRWPRQTGSSFPDCPAVTLDGLDNHADDDGIVCIPSVRGQAQAAERLRSLLAAAYGKAWTPSKLDELLSAVDYAASNLEDWLRNGFFDQHSKLFHHRPFIWQIWDGRKDGFSALVNYHKLDYKLLEKLTYTYLGEWIKKQQEAVAKEESGADDRLLKARQLQGKLQLILEGDAPYDIFVRWKPLEQQSIGWHPDLNDGVRLNIRPFIEADVLRKRPNIKWGTDRGKNPPGSPWGEERNNDRHLTLEEKRAGRPQA